MSSLPEHLINQIIDKIPIYTIVNKHTSSVPTIIDSYVNEYIDTKLLTNFDKCFYLLEHPLYSSIINAKLFSISQNVAQQFIKLSGNSININDYSTNPIKLIKFDILFKYAPFLENEMDSDNRLTITNFNTMGNNKCNIYFCGNLYSINFDENSISNEIMMVLLKHIITHNNSIYSNFNISSMKIIKSYYPNGLSNNSIDETLINYL